MVRTLITDGVTKFGALFGADLAREATGSDVAVICAVCAVIGIASLIGYLKCDAMFGVETRK